MPSILPNMSSGVDATDQRTSLRAVAHPLRLRMLSLLTGAAMSAAEVARELDITHANASYHLRQLHAAGLLDTAGEESIRGGRAKRYRHHPTVDPLPKPADPAARRLLLTAVAGELVRRAPAQVEGPGRHHHMTDAELWVDPEEWAEVVRAVHAASERLHAAARSPRAEGTVRTSATLALFEMDADPR
jgi:DNA-binding transcriptional ArsR family regulator